MGAFLCHLNKGLNLAFSLTNIHIRIAKRTKTSGNPEVSTTVLVSKTPTKTGRITRDPRARVFGYIIHLGFLPQPQVE